MEKFTVYCIPVIGAICYAVIELIKILTKNTEQMKNLYPALSACIGAALGIVMFFMEPEWISDSVLEAGLIGMASGLSATGGDQIVKRMAAFFHKEDSGDTEK